MNTSNVESLRFAPTCDQEEEKHVQLQLAVRRHLPQNFSFPSGQSSAFRGQIDRYAIADVILVETAATCFAAERTVRRGADALEGCISLMYVATGQKLVHIADREYLLGAGDVLAFNSDAVDRVAVPDWMAKSQLTIRKTDLQDLGVSWHEPGGVRLSATGATKFLFGYLDLVRQTLTTEGLTDRYIWAMRNATVELAMAALYDMQSCPSSVSVRSAVRHVPKVLCEAIWATRL